MGGEMVSFIDVAASVVESFRTGTAPSAEQLEQDAVCEGDFCFARPREVTTLQSKLPLCNYSLPNSELRQKLHMLNVSVAIIVSSKATSQGQAQ
jgi:hypothetical protein